MWASLSTSLLACQPKSQQPWFNSPDVSFLPFNNKGSISGCGLFVLSEGIEFLRDSLLQVDCCSAPYLCFLSLLPEWEMS